MSPPPQPAVTDANAPLVLDGAINIRDLEAQYELKLPQDEGFETLAGFLLSRLQKMPTGGEAFDYEGQAICGRKNGRPSHSNREDRASVRGPSLAGVGAAANCP